MNIGNLIKRYRKDAKMTQEQVAKQLFVAKNTYSQYENGVRNIESEMFFKILEVFGVTTEFSYEDINNIGEHSLIIYKDELIENPRFLIEKQLYDPIRKRHIVLESVNGGISHSGWVSGIDGMNLFDFIQNHDKISNITYQTYQDFDFENHRHIVTHSSRLVCSLAFITFLIRKEIEQKFSIIPRLDIKNDEELLYLDWDETCFDTCNVLNRVNEKMNEEKKDEEDWSEFVENFFSYYFHKNIKKVFFDEQNDTFTLLF